MSLTAWRTYASGDLLTAADRNTYERDNGRWITHNSSLGAPICRAYNSTTQAGVSNGAVITLDSEHFDLGPLHSTVSNTSRLTVPASSAGTYLIGASVRCNATPSAANAEVAAVILHNGATQIGEHGTVLEPTAARRVRLTPVTLYHLAVTDYVELQINFTNMTNVDVEAVSDYSPALWATWIGEQ